MFGSASDDVYKQLDRPPQVYLALFYDKKYKVVDLNGHYKKTPHPHEMSGDGIWILPTNPPIAETFEMRKLVGIVLAYQTANGVILGIKIPIVLEMMRSVYPELTDEIPKSSLLKVIVKNTKLEYNAIRILRINSL